MTPSPASADALYRGFPDFADWGPLDPAETDLWDRFAASLAERRWEATPETLKRSVDVAVRAAALDTGAIEGLYAVDRGFTMTVAVQGLAWQQMIEERGAGVRKLFEAQLEAYELVLDAVTQKQPVTEVWIRALHEVLCAPQKTYRVLTPQGWQEHDLPKGEYKKLPNHVLLTDETWHPYAPVDQVSSEVHRLIEEIQKPEFEAAHPILQASYVHFALVVIHPFADGNGRVARALASTFFYRACSIPLLIFANQRPAYLDALREADRGDSRRLLAFFRDRGIETMQLVLDSLLTAGAPTPEEVSARLKAFLIPGGLSHATLDALAGRLLAVTQNEVRTRFDQIPLNPAISLNLAIREDRVEPTPGYRRMTRSPRPELAVDLKSEPPADATAAAIIRVLIADDDANPFTFRIEAQGSGDFLEIRSTEVHPELAEGLRLRLSGWTQRLLSKMLSELDRRARATLQRLR